jgi:ASC-1-like (ASCH) protein
MMIRVEKVKSGRKLRTFIDFSHDLYEGDPNYVPELFVTQKDLLDPKKHPFFEHSKLDLFLAYKNNQVVGRIAAIRNNNHISFTGQKEGFFGFFECINDYDVAKSLFNTAKEWVKNEGLTAILGPTNFSTNETCGWLTQGYELPPVVMMTYNKSYYLHFAEQYGFVKKMDLLAFNISSDSVSEKSIRVSEAFESRLKSKGISIRTIDMKNFEQEAQSAVEVYNAAWDKNWGFIPMTKNEFMHLAKEMKSIMDPELCFVAEHNGKMIGFSLTVPDINQVLRTVKRGRLLPFGIFKLLFNRKKINKARVVVLGVVEGYRKLGIEACFYANTIKACRKNNFNSAEASWILETNEMMKQGAKNINGEVYKTYRIYELPL